MCIIKDNKFFKSLKGLTDKYVKELAQSIEFVQFNKGEDIFEYGSQGDKFYVIMNGLVGVNIPNPRIKSWKYFSFYCRRWKTKTIL